MIIVITLELLESHNISRSHLYKIFILILPHTYHHYHHYVTNLKMELAVERYVQRGDKTKHDVSLSAKHLFFKMKLVACTVPPVVSTGCCSLTRKYLVAVI